MFVFVKRVQGLKDSRGQVEPIKQINLTERIKRSFLAYSLPSSVVPPNKNPTIKVGFISESRWWKNDLAGPLFSDDNEYGFKEDAHVQREASIVNVIQVKQDHVFEGYLTSAGYLPQS
jgi:hypothetical protein